MPSFTTTELLSDIKQKAFIPTSQVTFTDVQLLAMADDELRMRLMPLILGVREDYYLTYNDITLTAATLYDIPTRALAGKIKDIFNIQNTQVFVVPYLPLHLQSQDYVPAPRNLYFSFQNNQISLYNPGQQNLTGVLRLYFYQRPGNFVLPADGAQVTNVDAQNNQITVTVVPSGWVVGSTVDMQNAEPHFQYRAIDQVITAINSTTLTFASLPSTIAIGDWVTLANESVVVQVPVEFQGLLAHYVAEQVLEALGATEEAATVEKSIKKVEESLIRLISPRADSVTKKIVSYRGIMPSSRVWPWY